MSKPLIIGLDAGTPPTAVAGGGDIRTRLWVERLLAAGPSQLQLLDELAKRPVPAPVLAEAIWRHNLGLVDPWFRDIDDWLPLLDRLHLPAAERLLALDLLAQLLDTLAERFRWRERAAAAGTRHKGVGPHRVGQREAHGVAALRAGEREAFRRHLRSWAAARGGEPRPAARRHQARPS